MDNNPQFQQNYPAFLDLQNHRVLVIGDGRRAQRKISRLINSGADVHLYAVQPGKPLRELCLQHNVTIHQQSITKDDLDGASLVFAASQNDEDNQQLARECYTAGRFVNVAQQSQYSNFLVPSLIDRSPMMIAVSSTGTSPILARLLTARLEAFIPHTYRHLAQLGAKYRDKIKQHIPDWRRRKRFWEHLLSGRVAELILQGRDEAANKALEEALTAHDPDNCVGEVYLVGAGPGDPDLLSFRALRLMQQCDVVLYDRLVSEQIMALVNKQAEHIYVGKQRSDHAMPQQSINQCLAELALKGKRVLRLKGGDPFMFGRGGEEIETLSAQNVPFQIVPGITAATGCASYAGIPLTHRDHAQACLFVTGHLKDGTVNLDWQALARPNQTVVIYMGLVGLPHICHKLIESGLSPDHPIALVAQGTLTQQHVVTGTLGCMPAKINDTPIKPPTLIIIGSVVKLREKLAWFDPE